MPNVVIVLKKIELVSTHPNEVLQIFHTIFPETNKTNSLENDTNKSHTKEREDNNKIFQYSGIADVQSKINQKKINRKGYTYKPIISHTSNYYDQNNLVSYTSMYVLILL